MEKVELAQLIATFAHIGQKDLGGTPYICHPKAVASMVNKNEEKVVAWLHDVVEDTPVTLSNLKKIGFSKNEIAAIDAITRRKGESRKGYLHRVSQNKTALHVKIADLLHNLDISRIENPTQKDIERVQRYKEELKWLINSYK